MKDQLARKFIAEIVKTIGGTAYYQCTPHILWDYAGTRMKKLENRMAESEHLSKGIRDLELLVLQLSESLRKSEAKIIQLEKDRETLLKGLGVTIATIPEQDILVKSL